MRVIIRQTHITVLELPDMSYEDAVIQIQNDGITDAMVRDQYFDDDPSYTIEKR